MSEISLKTMIKTLVVDHSKAELIFNTISKLQKDNVQNAQILKQQLEGLTQLCNLIREMPSLYRKNSDNEQRTFNALVEHLSHYNTADGALGFPLKAILSQALLIAKIQFFRACVRFVTIQNTQDPSYHTLDNQLHEELAEAVYTQLAEQILLDVLQQKSISEIQKHSAAKYLIDIWEDDALEATNFCPLIDAAWLARNHIDSTLGSLLGTTEYINLVNEYCPSEFLDFFDRSDVSEDERNAFEEFLFDMTYEEISLLRHHMDKEHIAAINCENAEAIIGRTIDHEHTDDFIQPMALHRSFMRRQRAAQLRNANNTQGPKQTAETYIMLHLLQKGSPQTKQKP